MNNEMKQALVAVIVALAVAIPITMSVISLWESLP